MVKPDLAAAKVARARGWLDRAERLISVPVEELVADADRRRFLAIVSSEAGV